MVKGKHTERKRGAAGRRSLAIAVCAALLACTTLAGALSYLTDVQSIVNRFALSLRGEEYAVYSEKDASFSFYRGTPVEVGQIAPDGQKADAVYTGFEDLEPEHVPDWQGDDSLEKESIKEVSFKARVMPTSLCNWFAGFTACEGFSFDGLLDTSRCVDFRQMFKDCGSLKSLDLSGFDTASADASFAGGMLSGCSSLAEVALGGGFTLGGGEIALPTQSEPPVSGADGKWYKIKALGALDYVDGEAFEAKAVTSGFTWSAVAPVKPYSPEPFAVYSAGDKSLTFYNRAGRPEEGSAFEGKAATKVYADFIGSTYESAAAVPWSNEAAQVAYVSFADEIAPEGSVAYWFAGLTRAVAVDIGENLDTSGCTDFSHMFEGCSNMTLLHVDYLDTAAGTNFGNMFSGCSKLGKIDLSSFDTGKATAMAGMFDGMVMLSEVTLGDAFTFSGIGKNYLCMLPTPGAAFIPDANGLWHTAAGTSYAPGKVPNLKADTYYANAPLVALLYNDGQLVFQRGGAVDQDRELMEGENTWVGFESDPRAGAPWAVRAADVASVRVRDIARPVNCAGWFEGMGNCTSMSLARLDTSMSVSFASMFEGCSSLAGLNVDSFVTSSALSFERMFAGCSSLGVLSLSGFDTSLSQRASGMFDGMDRLKEVTIGDKFSFLAGGYLPAPSDEFIAGADGYWRDIESRPYAPEEVPSGTALGIAATYWAVDEPACAFLYEGGRLVFQRGTEPNLAYGTVAASFDGFETAKPSSAGDVLWNAYRDQVTSVEFENAVFPVSCAYWFSGMPNCTKIDLTLLNTTRAEAMEGMFTDDAIEILAVGANFWLTGKDMGTDAGTVNPAAEFPSPKDGKKNAQWQTVDKPNVKADQVDDCPAKTNKRDATHLVFYSDSDVMAAATRSLLAELEEESEATLSEEPSDLAPGAADAEPPTGIVDEAVDESQERDPEKGEDTPEAAGPEADAGAGEPDVPEEGTSDKDPGSDAGAAAAAAVGAACAVAARKRIRGRHARA